MNKHLTIDYIELPASDFSKIQEFYQAVFSWTFESYGDGYLAFSDGRIDGGFYKSEKTSHSETGACLVVFYSEKLEDTHEKVKAAGGTIIKDTFSFPGGRRFQFLDPHGNELAVWTDAN